MRLRERLKKMYDSIHQVISAVLERRISTQEVIDAMQKLLQEKEKSWWETEGRYKNWVLDPITPELLQQDEDNNFEKTYWKRLDISKFKKGDEPHLLGPDIYKYLMDIQLLQFCPSIEALDFYMLYPDERKKWDYTDNWVFAWRDVVISNRHPHNLLVPGMRINSKTGKVVRKFIPLHDICRLKFKVIYRI